MSPINISLREAGELSLIRAFEKVFRSTRKDLVLGVGDDCSVVSFEGRKLLLTTDAMVEGVHFSLRLAGHSADAVSKRARSAILRSVAHRAVASCLSDIAAMGGRPLHGVVSVGLPGSFLFGDTVLLAETMQKVAKKFGGVIVGGDTVESDVLFLSVSFTGSASKGRYVTRGGARPGDEVLVTGDLGNSSAGLVLLEKAESPGNVGREKGSGSGLGRRHSIGADSRARLAGLFPEFGSLCEEIGTGVVEKALRKHLFPTPRFAEGEIACVKGATSMIDVSDGLATELNHLARSSSVQIEIDSELLPVGEAARKVGAHFHRDPLSHALLGGEEYELVFTAPPKKAAAIIATIRASTGTRVTRIGVVKKGRASVALREGNKVVLVRRSGYEHFSRGGK